MDVSVVKHKLDGRPKKTRAHIFTGVGFNFVLIFFF